MKKIFMVPLLAILMAIPMIAGAVPVAGEPVAGDANSPTATSAPKYALKGAESSDENAALVSYVKGAYNALVKGINKTQEEINTLNTGIGTYADSVNHLLDNTATQTGTVATIKNATSTEQISSSSVNIGNVTTTSISATASGDVNLSVPIMNDWATDSLAENPVEMTTSFSNLAVNNLTMSAPTTNTATLTKTGISGDVNVSKYLATSAAYTRLEYLESTGTQYIDTGYIPTNATRLDIKYMVTQLPSKLSAGACPIGGRVTWQDRMFGIYSPANQEDFNIVMAGNSSADFGNLPPLNKEIIATIDIPNNNRALDIEGTVFSSNGGITSVTYVYPLYMFQMNNTGNASKSDAHIRIYYVQIKEGDNIIHDFIPVLDTDGTPTMYDKITSRYFYNIGTGEFIAGPELQ